MKILIFHPVLLPPKDYGGVERVVLWLSKGLAELGYDIWVGAEEGSQLPIGVKLLPFKKGEASAYDLVKKIKNDFDMIHFMAPPEGTVFSDLKNKAILTVHGNGKPGEKYPLNTVFLTRNHAERHGASCYVWNAIDPNEYLFSEDEKRRDSFLFLSKTSWSVKNLSGTIELAKRAKVKLNIAGGSRPFLLKARSFFNTNVTWSGPVSGFEKAQLLEKSKALLFPVKWPEPFGLVVVESLMSGTPVIASDRGGISELITSDTGICLPLEEDGIFESKWMDSIQNVERIFSRKSCRERALSFFQYSRMAKQYLELYKKVSLGGFLNSNEPLSGDWRTQK